MGAKQTVLEKRGFTVVKQEMNEVLVRSKEGHVYTVREIRNADDIFVVNEILQKLEHPHIVGHQQSFTEGDTLYVLTDHHEDRSLFQKVDAQGKLGQPFSEEQILDWIVEICMALKHLHDNSVVHKDLRPQNVFFTEFGSVCLGEVQEIKDRAGPDSGADGDVSNIPPELLSGDVYHDKSDIWLLGCLTYLLCMLKWPFTAESTIKLIPKILNAEYPALPDSLSPDLGDIIREALQVKPEDRPSAKDILCKPGVIRILAEKSVATVEDLQSSVIKLRALADGLEKFHYGATIGSLTGGVVGVVGGITSIVGLILAPVTLGASLIVTGVGVGVAVAGGATAGISNITNMVNQSSDRQSIKNIVREFEEKMNSVVKSLQYISEGLQALENVGSFSDGAHPSARLRNAVNVGCRLGRGLGAIPELVRLLQVVNLGKVAAQAARIAEVATGILSAFFVAVDIFFIAVDAKEIHNIKQSRAPQSSDDSSKLELLNPENMAEEQPGSEERNTEVKSATMKFVLKVRETADQLQDSVDELSDIIKLIPKIRCFQDIGDAFAPPHQ
ncbi:5'-AMP-activated protein kinase catalytic subunit alpha-2-like [Denticeps clupeoides]|uniref:5'-AMP-activated protein kinase catalytic subunit alpha-2-like n=1 Tax=Denticeps clupeoides TaxID=299321 RepID=UPI0010A2F219|nr:5'-AMP-activated protein kinase catalytic subunit alpha-2-like [Denticeps clupeoides]